eukprot:Amastigsp_a339960_35.p6 type:complete len:109 gc:universal Amastigsp_a339960_35:1829-1503(-)
MRILPESMTGAAGLNARTCARAASSVAHVTSRCWAWYAAVASRAASSASICSAVLGTSENSSKRSKAVSSENAVASDGTRHWRGIERRMTVKSVPTARRLRYSSDAFS